MMEKEEWRPVKGSEGKYEVSDRGHVRSLSRKAYCGTRGETKIYRPVTSKILKTRFVFGCATVAFKSKTKVIQQVATIVAKAFLPNPNNYKGVIHKDNDKTNNKVSNLEWGLRNARSKKKVIRCSMEGVAEKTYDKLSDCVDDGYCMASVSQCCHGKLHKHRDKKWKFETKE